MTEILRVALEKAADLPESVQEEIGLEVIDRVAAWKKLKADIQVGIDQLDAGLGREIDFEELIKELHEEHARRWLAATQVVARS
jgi:hypothetical protein